MVKKMMMQELHYHHHNLSLGSRFWPTDQELVDCYLRRRIAGLPIPECLIREGDVYHQEPWTLPSDSFIYGHREEKEMFFFTRRHPSSTGSQRASHTAGVGYWDGLASEMIPIKNRSGQVIGHKLQLNFKLRNGEKKEKKKRTNWIMDEYHLHSSSSNNHNLVLCRIHEKKGKC